MSQEYQISMVGVNAVEMETVRLGEVFGHTPSAEVVEVLASDWARSVGWRVTVPGQAYSRTLNHGVRMEVTIEPEGEVTLRRVTDGLVPTGTETEAERRLQEKLRAVAPEYNLAFHELVGRTMALAVSRAASQTGGVVEQHEVYNQETLCLDLTIMMQLPEHVLA